jgi:hypothetical protein
LYETLMSAIGSVMASRASFGFKAIEPV